MGRKAKAIVDQNPPEQSSKPTPKLTAAQYWEFRTNILELEMFSKDLEIAKLNARIKNLELSVANKMVNEVTIKAQKAKMSYDEYLSNLEKEIGTPIKGKIINPINFSVMSENDPIVPGEN